MLRTTGRIVEELQSHHDETTETWLTNIHSTEASKGASYSVTQNRYLCYEAQSGLGGLELGESW